MGSTDVIIALDEIDNIGTDDNVLYKLGRANNRNAADFVDPDDTKVGLVGITNDGTFRDQLDPRVKSTLCDHEIHFPPYNANELRTILQDRAEDAFHDDVLTGDVIPLVAAFAAQRVGYARDALDLLYTAGNIARNDDEDQITEDHVRRAEDQIQQGAIVTEVNELSTQGKLIVYTLLRMQSDGELPAKLDKIYAWYETFANQADADTVTPRWVGEILNSLVMNGVIRTKEVNFGKKGGRHFKYELGTSRELIVDGLKGSTRIENIDTENLL